MAYFEETAIAPDVVLEVVEVEVDDAEVEELEVDVLVAEEDVEPVVELDVVEEVEVERLDVGVEVEALEDELEDGMEVLDEAEVELVVETFPGPRNVSASAAPAPTITNKMTAAAAVDKPCERDGGITHQFVLWKPKCRM